MKQIQNFIFLFFFVLLINPFNGFTQNSLSADAEESKLIEAAKEMMKAAGTCALVTLDEEGRPRVRAMDPFLPEDNLVVWFGTTRHSRKVKQIKNDPRVTLYYLDSDASGYVMIQGAAELVDDKKEKEKRWKEEWEAFYQNKAEDYILIKVTPKSMEISSNPKGIVSDTKTWQPPIVYFK